MIYCLDVRVFVEHLVCFRHEVASLVRCRLVHVVACCFCRLSTYDRSLRLVLVPNDCWFDFHGSYPSRERPYPSPPFRNALAYDRDYFLGMSYCFPQPTRVAANQGYSSDGCVGDCDHLGIECHVWCFDPGCTFDHKFDSCRFVCRDLDYVSR